MHEDQLEVSANQDEEEAQPFKNQAINHAVRIAYSDERNQGPGVNQFLGLGGWEGAGDARCSVPLRDVSAVSFFILATIQAVVDR